MALHLISTSERVTLVHSSDPDVGLQPNDSRRGWLSLAELEGVPIGPGANRVTVRALNGIEYLSCLGDDDLGERTAHVLRRGVVAVDDKPWSPEVEVMVSRWPGDILSPLVRRIRELSEGPTQRRS